MSGVVSGCHNAGKGQDGPQHTIIRPERQQGPGRGLCCLEFTKASTEPLLCAGLHSNPTRRWGHGAPRHTAMTGQRRDSNLDAPDSKPQPGAIPEEPDPPGLEWGLQRTHTLPRTLGKQRSELVLFIETHVTVSLGAESGGCGHVLRAGFLFLNFSTYREHVCSASKNQSLFRKAAVQPQSPTQRFDPGESLHPSTERVNRHGPPCSAQKRPRRTGST